MIRTPELARLAVALFATVALASGTSLRAEEDKSDGKWHFSITPYLWLPDVSGSVTYNNAGGSGANINAQVDPNSYLQSLDFAAMFTAEARKDNWLVFTDYIYLHMGGDESAVKSVTGPGGILSVPVNVAGSTDLVANVWTLAGGYTVLRKPDVSVDLFAGTRLLDLKTSLGWNFTGPAGGLLAAGSVSQTFNKWDGIVGVKGRILLGSSRWSVPYYLDLGTGSSSLTWQGMLGVAYSFPWGGVTLAYRNLYYDEKDDKLLQNLRFTGPALGATFRF